MGGRPAGACRQPARVVLSCTDPPPSLRRSPCRMWWWVGGPLALSAAAYVIYGWKGLVFWVGQALLRWVA